MDHSCSRMLQKMTEHKGEIRISWWVQRQWSNAMCRSVTRHNYLRNVTSSHKVNIRYSLTEGRGNRFRLLNLQESSADESKLVSVCVDKLVLWIVDHEFHQHTSHLKIDYGQASLAYTDDSPQKDPAVSSTPNGLDRCQTRVLNTTIRVNQAGDSWSSSQLDYKGQMSVLSGDSRTGLLTQVNINQAALVTPSNLARGKREIRRRNV